jgi:RNA dependent RNA polymerase
LYVSREKYIDYDAALSRNSATLTLERSQIRDRDDIPFGPDNEEMTGGAGRISPTLALKVTQKLGLSFSPSGFQGRLGEAKGFWSVDYGDKTGIDWIETCGSQRKWKRSEGLDDESHRTFEVVGWSAPLRSKGLNQQLLPILIDRAKDREAMKRSIETLLREGFSREVKALRTAMDNPQSFRKWLWEFKSNVSERLKAGRVLYRAGLPDSIEERLNMLLDGGFHPQHLFFMKEMARKIFKIKCDELEKKLSIAVPKSASIFMVPDFWGVLEPNEVYIDFSSFVDESGFSGINLHGQEVLVTRSPAHFVSDVQKVTVVAKVELIGLEDVIVFPVKGNPSLAKKLSRGRL